MPFTEFSKWFSAEPIWHKMQIENVTVRDMGKTVKATGSNKASVLDIYRFWYLPRIEAVHKTATFTETKTDPNCEQNATHL